MSQSDSIFADQRLTKFNKSKSEVWGHFGYRSDKSVAVCFHCQAEIRHCGNTTNLHSHLKRLHSDKTTNLNQGSHGLQECSNRSASQSNMDNYIDTLLISTSQDMNSSGNISLNGK